MILAGRWKAIKARIPLLIKWRGRAFCLFLY